MAVEIDRETGKWKYGIFPRGLVTKDTSLYIRGKVHIAIV